MTSHLGPYPVGGTIPQVGNRFTPSTAPSWFTSATTRRWNTIGQSFAASNIDAGSIWPSRALFEAWCTACMRQSNGDYIIPAQGGHTDSGDNAVYALRFKEESPTWRVLDTRTASPPTSPSVPDWSGKSASNHGYGLDTYADNAELVIRGFLGGIYLSGAAHDDIHAWSPTTGWDTTSFGLSLELAPSNTDTTGSSAYDSDTGLVFCSASYNVQGGARGGLMVVNPQTQTRQFTGHIIPQDGQRETTGAAGGGLFVMTDGLRIVVWETGNFSAAPYITSSITNLPATINAPGIVWSPKSNAFLLWPGSGATIYRLQPVGQDYANFRTSGWEAVAVTNNAGGQTPDTTYSQGHYGKLQLIRDMGNGDECLVNIPRETSTPMFYRLPEAA